MITAGVDPATAQAPGAPNDETFVGGLDLRAQPAQALDDAGYAVGLLQAQLLRAADEAPEVIVLTTFEADDYVVRALRAGAGGFLLKDTPPAEIVRAVRNVAAGEPVLSPAITRRLIGHVTESEADERELR